MTGKHMDAMIRIRSAIVAEGQGTLEEYRDLLEDVLEEVEDMIAAVDQDIENDRWEGL